MWSSIRLPFALETRRGEVQRINLSQSWQFCIDSSDQKEEVLESLFECITTPFQADNRQQEYVVKQLLIKQLDSNPTTHPLFISLVNKCVSCQLVEIAMLSNARFIEIYSSDQPSIQSATHISELSYIATIKGTQVHLGDVQKKLFAHEFKFPEVKVPSSPPARFLHLKYLSIKSNASSSGPTICEIINWRLLIQSQSCIDSEHIAKDHSLTAEPDQLVSPTLAAISPSLVAERLQDIQQLKNDLSQLKEIARRKEQNLKPEPRLESNQNGEQVSQLTPVHMNSSQLQLLFKQLQRDIFNGIEEMLDRRLAPILDRINRLERQFAALHSMRQSKEQSVEQTSNHHPSLQKEDI